MKTAMVSVLTLGGTKSSPMNSSPAVLSAVDAYATRVLQTMSPPEAYIDTSLGPYVTTLLRSVELRDKEQVTKIAEFDSLVELLEDQCCMEQEAATNALKEIANAVCTGTVPNDAAHESPSMSLFPMGALDSFHAGSPGDYQGFYNRNELSSIDPYTPNSAGGPSPLKPDNLIPVDLLGALDDPSPHMSRYQTQRRFVVQEQKDEISKNIDSFPPLGASTTAPPKKGGRGKKASKAQHHDKELAASLFRPARPRQNSIETEEAATAKAPAPAATRVPSASANNRYFQQQWDSSVEILLSMTPELSEEAAVEASLMANTDFNVAQYIIDTAMSAPPVCRHMLHDGCYRSDCQFSHDVDGHTCLFWLRGRCGKGNGCKFLHGFNDKILAGIKLDSSPPPVGRSEPVPIARASRTTPVGNQYKYSSFQASSAPTSDGFLGYPPGRLGSSWQSPSLLQSSVSGSYSSRDSNSGGTSSFANIASRGMDKAQFPSPSETIGSSSVATIPTVRIPQDLWNPHENRDASVFHVPDPLERYYQASAGVTRRDVIDLHFQSIKTFPGVLSTILPAKLTELEEVWIVTGTGHHVGTKTHQKGGGALEMAAINWLTEEGYNFAKGRDRNGLGGALLVRR
jgi:hypothetical protein